MCPGSALTPFSIDTDLEIGWYFETTRTVTSDHPDKQHYAEAVYILASSDSVMIGARHATKHT
jgi:hypothetical protein